MGNSESKKSSLRDDDVYLSSGISTVKSNIILALNQGNFYPCVIVRHAESIPDGYTVYFFHNGEETEIPSTNVIGDLKALLDCEINFVDDNGANCSGIVRATDSENEQKQPMNFFISTGSVYKWVSLPFIYMTKEQVKIFT